MPDRSQLGGPDSAPRTETAAQLAATFGAELLESPVWDERQDRLAVVDILQGGVHWFDPASRTATSQQLGAPVGAIIPRQGGGWSAAVGNALRALSHAGEGASALAQAPEQPGYRFNDAKADPSGVVWAGWLTDTNTGEGSLLRMEPGAGVEIAATGIGLPNGMGWTVSGREMCFIDSLAQRIDRYEFEPVAGVRGEMAGSIDLADAPGLPDGMTVDAEDHVWVALWGGGEVRRYSPDGRHVATVSIPVAQVTSCEFGGSDLRDLYITTARYGMDPEALRAEPLAGDLFVARPGVVGQPNRKHRD